jgi:hypothetical protein
VPTVLEKITVDIMRDGTLFVVAMCSSSLC